jgi:hypothetical protein
VGSGCSEQRAGNARPAIPTDEDSRPKEAVANRGFGSSLNLMLAHNLGCFFNEECYQTLACEIVSAFRKQFLEHFSD